MSPETPTHESRSPSGRPRWRLCPGSIREEAKYPDVSGAAADDGTHTHTVIEKALFMEKPEELIGKTLTDHVGTFEVDIARFTRAKVCLDYVKKRERELLQMDGRGPVTLAEARVDPVGYVGRSDMSGTVDIQIHGLTELEIIDYKDGGKPVEPNSPQPRQYGVGALAGQLPGRFLNIRLTIVQPKLAGRMDPIRSHVEPVDAFLRTEIPALIAEGAATDKPDAPLVPGETQCMWCRAKHNCTARANAAMDAMGMMFQSAGVPPPNPNLPAVISGFTPPQEITPMDLAQQAAGKDPALMDPQQIRQLIEAAPLIRQVLESAEAEALRRMQSGMVIPGLKLVNGRGSRRWAFPDEEMEDKLKGLGIPKGSIYKSELISPAQAEKITWTKRDGTAEQLSPKQIERMKKEYIVQMAGKLTVVGESDPRPSAVIDTSPMFGPVAVTPAPTVDPAAIAATMELPSFLVDPAPADEIPDWMK